jgi:hypothetical protein
MQHWEKHHGIKHVVVNLKKFHSDLQAPSSRIKKHRDGSWRGDFRPLWNLSTKGRRGLAHASRVLRVYGRWEAKDVYLKDIFAFKRTIESPEPALSELSLISRRIHDAVTEEDLFLGAMAQREAKFDTSYPGGPKTSPSMDGLKPLQREVMTPRDHVDAAIKYSPNLLRTHHQFINLSLVCPIPEQQEKDDTVGVVQGLTKDRGLKVRFVANPFMVYQLALSRLKDACRIFLETSCAEQSVFDQEKGVKWVETMLSSGRRITSLDLSSCSDLLPALPQFYLLKRLFPHLSADIDLFFDISRAKFLLHPDLERIPVHWKVGQPLGSAPSFFSFTLLLLFIVRTCGGTARSFRIIGDDLVMDASLTRRVVKTYTALGAPINWSKSIVDSDRFAEFAGRWVDRYGSLRSFKASPLDINRDPMGYIRQYGYKAITLLPHKYRKMLGILSLFPAPIGVEKKSQVMSRLPESIVNTLYSKSFQPLPVRDRALPEIFRTWFRQFQFSPEMEAFEEEEFGPYWYDSIPLVRVVEMSEDFIRRLAFLSHKNKNNVLAYASAIEEYYTFDTLCTYRGVGVWTGEGSRFWTLADYQEQFAKQEFNELVNDDRLVAHHEPLMEEIYNKLKGTQKRPEYHEVQLDLVKPLNFYQKVWKKVKRLFPGKLRF